MVCDLDRTLLNTGLVFDIFQNTLIDLGYDGSERLLEARRQLEASGGSFDVFKFIRSVLPPEQFERAMETFRDNASEHDLLNEGAGEFLTFLKEREVNFGILTKGSDRWQREKLIAAGLDEVPTIIIPKEGKGKLITTWYDTLSDQFILPLDFGGGTYGHLVMIDDKVSEFGRLSLRAIGLVYRPETNILPSQSGNIEHDNLHEIRSFEEATQYLGGSV